MQELRTQTKVRAWTLTRPSRPVANRIRRVAALDDVQAIAVLPDVHLANDYCVGTTVATRNLILPHAIGGDIGCGMMTIALDTSANVLRSPIVAERIHDLIRQFVPVLTKGKPRVPDQLPSHIDAQSLSAESLRKAANRNGRLQLGTLGRGNHFVELQADASNALWILVHSGSRGLGQAITQFHLRRARSELGVACFEASSELGQAYLNDVQWAVHYAQENRRQLLMTVAETLRQIWRVDPIESSLFGTDHNHVRREQLADGEWVWMHRKGTQPAATDDAGIIPGSMGTATYHVRGRGNSDSLNSCSHGAGRRLSRRQAHQQLNIRQFRRQMQGITFAQDRSRALIDEAPAAYNDIHQVVRAQRKLVRVDRVLHPLLNVKG